MRVGSSVVVVALLAAVASADPSAADIAFKKGRELLKAGKYADACAQFEQSQRLDPQLGTQYNIAQCDDKLGKLATALAIYRELAAKDTNAQRKATEVDLAGQLERRVPKLLVQLQAVPHGTAITAGARTIEPNKATPVDVGTYAITVHAPGYRDFTASVEAAESRTTTLAVTLVAAPAEAAAKPAPEPAPVAAQDEPPPAPATPSSSRKTYALASFTIGGVGLATGLVFGVLARSKWSDAKAACGGSQTCATPDDLARATELGKTAQSRATLSTIFVVSGVAFGAVGGYFWLTAPSEHALAVTPSAGPDGAGVSLSGRF